MTTYKIKKILDANHLEVEPSWDYFGIQGTIIEHDSDQRFLRDTKIDLDDPTGLITGPDNLPVLHVTVKKK